MDNMLSKPVPLVDITQVEDDELQKQKLIGIMSGALKHCFDRDIGDYMLAALNNKNLVDLDVEMALQFVLSSVTYMLSVGNFPDINKLVEQAQSLPQPLRGEFMTGAEQLKAIGMEKGIDQNREEITINLRRENAEPKFIAKVTEFDLATVLKLKAELNK